MYYIVVAVKHSTRNKCGNYCEKDPPVPIPNTVVKLLCAEDSEGFPFVKAGRCRSYLIGGLAQLGEHLPYKQGVTGSSPVGPTIKL